MRAVSGLAGVNLSVNREYDYGIDGTWQPVVIRGHRRVESGFPVDFQMKSTINWETRADKIIYDLEVKTYNDLVTRDAAAISCVLVLLCLPRDQAHWLQVAEPQMVLKNCCYWMKLPSGAPSPNQDSHRIAIPRSNLLTVQAVTDILRAERRSNQVAP